MLAGMSYLLRRQELGYLVCHIGTRAVARVGVAIVTAVHTLSCKIQTVIDWLSKKVEDSFRVSCAVGRKGTAEQGITAPFRYERALYGSGMPGPNIFLRIVMTPPMESFSLWFETLRAKFSATSTVMTFGVNLSRM